MASKLSKNLKIGIGVGIVALIALIAIYVTKEPPKGIREVIEQQLSAENTIDSNRKSQLRIQLALNDFQMKEGRLPGTLSELVPTYFDTIPVNSNTGKPWEYKVVNGMPRVGTPETVMAKADTKQSTSSASTNTSSGMSHDEEQALIASIEQSEAKAAFVYDPTGKRDPFMPYNAVPEIEDDENKTELEKYTIGQLRLTAILDGFEEPRALVETSTGKGFTIMKGTKIGTNSGEVVEISGDKVLILETTVDFTGDKKTKTIEMKLPSRAE